MVIHIALSAGVTARTNHYCLGLESGAADILALVTPTTAELLLWWFGEDMVAARDGLNFHTGQKQAILNAIVAHEVLGKEQTHWSLLDLYRACTPDALLIGTRLTSPPHRTTTWARASSNASATSRTSSRTLT